MKNGDKPAYPTTVDSVDQIKNKLGLVENGKRSEPGLTKRETFALNAPSMPEWFQYTSKLTRPKEPMSWVAMEEGEDRDTCRSWQHDPCFDLPDHLEWYQIAWDKYRAERLEYEYLKNSEQYFAWRLYFADELLKALKE